MARATRFTMKKNTQKGNKKTVKISRKSGKPKIIIKRKKK